MVFWVSAVILMSPICATFSFFCIADALVGENDNTENNEQNTCDAGNWFHGWILIFAKYASGMKR